MKDKLNFYINGKWVESDSKERIEIINPANEELIGHVTSGTKDDINKAVSAASDAFQTYQFSSKEDRIEILNNIITEYENRYDDLVQVITEEMGAPTWLSQKAQASTGIKNLHETLDALKEYEFEKKESDYTLIREPIGVIGMITPWNWPLNQMCTKVASAIAAGTSFVIKPSEITPGAAHLLAEVVDKTSLPKGIFNLIHGRGDIVGRAMSQHEDLEMISFTGSTRAGIDIQKHAADNIKRVSLELGGKSPNIILEDADLEKAVEMGIKQCFFNTGQSCSSPTRKLIPENLIKEATEYACIATQKMKTGDPNYEETFLGPISNKTQFEKVQALIQKGIDEGAELALGGVERPDGLDKGFYVKPTIFTNVKNEMQIAQEEIFGPVICLIPYKDIDEAVEIANDTPYGLSSMVSCSDIDKGHEIAKRIRAGQVIVNRISRGDYPAPFGGFKMSGNGREHGTFGLEEYLEVQAVIT